MVQNIVWIAAIVGQDPDKKIVFGLEELLFKWPESISTLYLSKDKLFDRSGH